MSTSPDIVTTSSPEAIATGFDHPLFVDERGIAHGGSNSFTFGDEPARFGVVAPDFETIHQVRSPKVLLVAQGEVTIARGLAASPDSDSLESTAEAQSKTYAAGEYLTFPVNEAFRLSTGSAASGGFSYVSRKAGRRPAGSATSELIDQGDVVASCEATLEDLKRQGIGDEAWFQLPREAQYDRLQTMTGRTGIVTIELNGHTIVAKDESSQLSGSHYARPWIATLRRFEEQGYITPGTTELRDITSGSSGATLALFATLLGYRVRLTVPEELPANRIYPMLRFGAQVVSSGPGYIQATSEVQRAEIYALKAAPEWERQRLPRDSGDKPIIFTNGTRRICYTNHSENQISVKAFAAIADELAVQVPDMTHLVLGEGNWTSIAGIAPRIRHLLPGVQVIGYTGEETEATALFGLTMDDRIAFRFKQPDVLDREEIVTSGERTAMASRPAVAAQHLGRSSVMGLVVADRILAGQPDARVCTVRYDRDDRY